MFFTMRWALTVMLALVACTTWAGLPMARHSFASSQDLANRLASGKGMNATADEYTSALQEYHPDALKGVKYLEEYAQNLEIVSCPQGVLYRLKSVENKGGRHLGEITRMFKPGEQCFKDRNIGEIVASASCGNVAMEASPSPKPAPRVEEVPQPAPQEDVCSRHELRDQYGHCYMPREVTVVREVERPVQQYAPPPQYYAPPSPMYGPSMIPIQLSINWSKVNFSGSNRYYPPPPVYYHPPPPPPYYPPPGGGPAGGGAIGGNSGGGNATGGGGTGGGNNSGGPGGGGGIGGH